MTLKMLELPINFDDSVEYIIRSDEGFWNNSLGWCSDESSAERYKGDVIKEHNYNLPIGNNVQMIECNPQNRSRHSERNAWTQSEKVCYIAHIWAEKETPFPCLQDFDFMEMAKAAQEFIDCQPENVEFIAHIENCFDALVFECENDTTLEWTIEHFTNYSLKNEGGSDVKSD